MQNTSTRISAALIVLGALVAGSAVQAQTAINQELALAGKDYGYGWQDAPGFPVAILASGSYKLTSNLIVPAGQSGIEIYAKGVTLDLNGFEIRTGALCTRTEGTGALSCNSGASGNIGVDFKVGGSVLRNGRISGFVSGVHYKGGDHLENLLVENNLHGIRSEAYSSARTLIRAVRAQLNQESGFWAHSALIQDSSSAGNGTNGFLLANSMVTRSFAANNNAAGFHAIGGTRLMVGGNAGLSNDGGDFVGTTSMGGNVTSLGSLY